LFYNRTKPTDRNIIFINEATAMEPTTSPNAVYDTTCTVNTVIQEQKGSTYTYVL